MHRASRHGGVLPSSDSKASGRRSRVVRANAVGGAGLVRTDGHVSPRRRSASVRSWRHYIPNES